MNKLIPTLAVVAATVSGEVLAETPTPAHSTPTRWKRNFPNVGLSLLEAQPCLKHWSS